MPVEPEAIVEFAQSIVWSQAALILFLIFAFGSLITLAIRSSLVPRWVATSRGVASAEAHIKNSAMTDEMFHLLRAWLNEQVFAYQCGFLASEKSRQEVQRWISEAHVPIGLIKNAWRYIEVIDNKLTINITTIDRVWKYACIASTVYLTLFAVFQIIAIIPILTKHYFAWLLPVSPFILALYLSREILYITSAELLSKRI